jgi:hypothetical protein
MNSGDAQKALTDLMKKHSEHGAVDSEGWHAVRRIEAAALECKPFPFTDADNPFELYEDSPGWEQASAELVAAAEVYWKAILSGKLGITIL